MDATPLNPVFELLSIQVASYVINKQKYAYGFIAEG